MATGINEEQGVVNVRCFKTYRPEHIHLVNTISRQRIFSYLRRHCHVGLTLQPHGSSVSKLCPFLSDSLRRILSLPIGMSYALGSSSA